MPRGMYKRKKKSAKKRAKRSTKVKPAPLPDISMNIDQSLADAMSSAGQTEDQAIINMAKDAASIPPDAREQIASQLLAVVAEQNQAIVLISSFLKDRG